ncbi:hypothetical protein Back2_17050 [Nocardioides baekrokdamisoli]|uniref:Uncharacterized protein n=1 Tax=Nocardioides baekrokdamisoli TaxID=1804624 RepID=A0A3G9J1A8_9ACTN|nr:hypothetical protein [Nocardioides baekrokdamisoli]BBH17418.1 hypothetical protein Back2_17050 [Nocardioides baekrokdamisoli]
MGLLLGGFKQYCFVVAIDDTNGNLTAGTTETTTTGRALQTPGVGVSLSGGPSSARTVDQQGGPFYYGGGSAEIRSHVSVGGGGYYGTNPCAPGGFVAGYEGSVGTGLGPSFEVHGGVSNTTTHTFLSVPLVPLLQGIMTSPSTVVTSMWGLVGGFL